VPVLLKYATAMTPGTMSPTGPAALGDVVGNALTLQFNRLNPAPVNYIVEASTDLVNWTTVATLAAGATGWTGTAAVSESGTSPVAVTVTDSTTISTTTPRFLRLRVSTATDTTIPGSVPQGSVPFSFAPSATTATSITIDNNPVARSTVQSVATSSVTVATAESWGNAASPYAVRFLTGGAAGATFPITAVTNNGSNYTLALSTQGVNLSTIAAAGDTYEVLPQDTLSSLFGTMGVSLQTGASASTADNIELWQSGGQFTYYNDGSNWRQAGSLITQNNTLLPSGAGILVVRRGSTSVPSYLLGRVPEVALRQFTTPGGSTLLAGPYPTNMTLASSGFSSASGWQAGASAATADTIMLYSGNAWLTFFYNGNNWRQSGTLLNQNAYVLSAGQPMFITRKSNPAPNLSFILQPLNYTP
jgi:hypothetical protein